MICRAGNEGACLQLGGREDSDLRGGEGCDVEGLPIGGHHHFEWRGEAMVFRASRTGDLVVIDVGIEMTRGDREVVGVDDGDAGLVEIGGDRWKDGPGARPFEANVIVRVGVADVEMTTCLLYTSPSPRDRTRSRMPSSA